MNRQSKLVLRLDALKQGLDRLPKSLLVEIGRYAARRIQAKARSGRTMADNVDAKMPALKASYIEQRRRWTTAMKDELKRARKKHKHLKKKEFLKGGIGYGIAERKAKSRSIPDLDPEFFSPARSNLTVTGQYNAGIECTVVDQVRKRVTIESTGERDDGLKNEELSVYLANMGRSIWGLDPVSKKVISRMVIDELRRNLKLR